jgi:hypothetical protein
LQALDFTRSKRYKGTRQVWGICILEFGKLEMPADKVAAAAKQAKLEADSRAAFRIQGAVSFGEAYLSEQKREELLDSKST